MGTPSFRVDCRRYDRKDRVVRTVLNGRFHTGDRGRLTASGWNGTREGGGTAASRGAQLRAHVKSRAGFIACEADKRAADADAGRSVERSWRCWRSGVSSAHRPGDVAAMHHFGGPT